MEWRKRWAGWPCTELLAPTIFHTSKHRYQYTYLGLYLFFDGATIFGEKMAFLPQNKKNFVVSCFSRSLNCVALPFLDMCLDIYGAWINQKKSFNWDIILENIAFFAKNGFLKQKHFFVMDQTFTIKHFT